MSSGSTLTTPPRENLPASGPAKPQAGRVPLFSAAAWSPLKVELFRNLYIATSVAQIGTWAREAASPWLMRLMTEGWHNKATMVGLVLSFSNLPICLFSVFAGALADVLDRRRLLIWTNVWMVVVSVILGTMTLTGHITPLGLLGLTFLLGVGTAATGPALQAILPELVPAKDMALAINLNSVALNVARAIGPATFILVIAVLPGFHGVGASFLLSALSFIAAIWVLAKWNRPHQRAAVHGEAVWGAIRSGFQYTIHSPANRAILLRVLAFIVPAVVFWSQVPLIASEQLKLSGGKSYAMLFAYMGLGAILGVLLMPGLHARFKIDPVVNVCTLLFALGLIALAFTHYVWLAAIILVFLGVNWVIIPTNFNTATQKSVPPWVKGRAISFYLTVLFGSFAIGGALWGRVTTATSIQTSLFIGGASMALLLVLARWFPLTLNEGLDLAPAFKPGERPGPESKLLLAAMDAAAAPNIPPSTAPATGANTPVHVRPAGSDNGVEVSIEYQLRDGTRDQFLKLAGEMARQRRRNGARHWRLTPKTPGHFIESFRFASRAELSRQLGRMSKADVAVHERLHAMHVGEAPPVVRETTVAGGVSARAGLAARFDTACDRALEELTNGIARVRGVRERAGSRPYF